MADVNNTGHDINGTNNNDENRSNKKRDGAGDMDDGTAENTTHAPADDGEEEEEDNSPRVFFDALHRRVLLLKPWRPNVLFISKKMDSTSAKRYRNRHRDAQDQSKTNHRPSPTDPQGDGVSHASTQQQQQQNQSSLLTSSLAAVASASSGWTELQLDLKGAENPLDIKLSSDKSLVAIRVCDKEVRVLSASTGKF